MAGIMEFLSAGVFHSTVSVDENAVRWQNGLVSKLHAVTGALFGLFTCTVFAKELLGDHIRCIRYSGDDSQISESTFNSYCYIRETFSLPYQDPAHPYHGVGPVPPDTDVIFHSYYQWIPYLFFIQAISFYIPYSCYKFSQDGRLGNLIQNLQNVIPFNENRDDKLGDIHIYLQDYYGSHSFWAVKLVLSDFLNLVNIILNILLMQWYLGSNFFTYGVRVIEYFWASEFQADPFDTVFPKMTKCTLELYGPSGTIQNMDGLCVLPINVLNEKVFFILWLWLVPLTIITTVEQIIWIFTILNKKYRNRFLAGFVRSSGPRKHLNSILNKIGFGDWLLLYLIARNIDRPLFTELANKIRKPGHGYYSDEEEEGEEVEGGGDRQQQMLFRGLAKNKQ